MRQKTTTKDLHSGLCDGPSRPGATLREYLLLQLLTTWVSDQASICDELAAGPFCADPVSSFSDDVGII